MTGRKLLLGCLALLSAVTVLADPGTLSGNRLFTTAEQRAALDAARFEVSGEPDVRDSRAEADAPVAIRGFVQRSGGPSTLWLGDGRGPRPEPEVRIDGPDVLLPRPGGGTVRVRPGQIYLPAEQEVVDGFRR